MQLDALISQIQSLDGVLKQEANKAVNRLLTLRNWLVGYYIVEYEQKGEGRAKYGGELLQNIAQRIGKEGLSYRNLKLFRQFFSVYPHIGFALIGQTLSAQSENILMRIWQTVSAELQVINNSRVIIHRWHIDGYK